MPRVIIKKKEESEEGKKDVVESVVLTSKKEFAELIEKYKKENPEKYEIKKAALEAQLNSLK